ncbi:MAG: RluA family pseudouridine synthase [Oscillospiraceae bacterium]|nr:RluA family pseudouridine synthase [Oscillospiraceae bacterium]
MKELIYKDSKAVRLDSWLNDKYPLIRPSVLNKFLRQNKVKVNGIKATAGQKLVKGDVVSLYVNDDYLLIPDKNNAFLFAGSQVEIIYEDENLFVVNKPSGISVIDDDWQVFDTLVNRIKHYYHKNSMDGNIPQLCHRIDTGTSGIVVLAKNEETLEFMFDMFRDKQLKKKYVCAVKNNPKVKDGIYKGYLTKNSQRGFVSVSEKPLNNASQNIETGIRTIDSFDRYKLLEIDLYTGRTHQIRAHCAYLGMPVLGDSKYGDNQLNRHLKLKYQLLCSSYLKLGYIDNEKYSYLSFKEFRCPDPWFVESFKNRKI